MDKYEEYEKINEELEIATHKIMEDMHKKSLINNTFDEENSKEESTFSGNTNIHSSSDLCEDYEPKMQQKHTLRNEALTAPLRRTIEKLKEDNNKYIYQVSQLKEERKQLIDDRRKVLKDVSKTVSEKQQLENTVSKLTLTVQQKNQELFIMKKEMESMSKRLKDKKPHSPMHLKEKKNVSSCNCVHEKDSFEKAEKELTKQGRAELATIAMTANNYNCTLLGCLKLQSRIIDNLKRQIKVQDDLARVSLKDEELIFATNQGNNC